MRPSNKEWRGVPFLPGMLITLRLISARCLIFVFYAIFMLRVALLRPHLVKAVAVDLFPHTDHCEMVMLLERQVLEEEPTPAPRPFPGTRVAATSTTATLSSSAATAPAAAMDSAEAGTATTSAVISSDGASSAMEATAS